MGELGREEEGESWEPGARRTNLGRPDEEVMGVRLSSRPFGSNTLLDSFESYWQMHDSIIFISFFQGSLSIPAPLKSFSTLTRKLSASNSLFIDSLPRSRSTSNGFGRRMHISIYFYPFFLDTKLVFIFSNGCQCYYDKKNVRLFTLKCLKSLFTCYFKLCRKD